MNRAARVGADEVGLVEAAYRIDGTETQWLEGLAEVATPLLGGELGVMACTFVIALGQVQVEKLICLGGPTGLTAAITSLFRDAPGIMSVSFGAGPCTTVSEAVGAAGMEAQSASQRMFDLGIRDAVGVLGIDPNGHGVTLAAYRPNYTILSRRMVSRWSRVASHLAAGFRVRRGLAAAEAARANPIPGCEAILTPNGHLSHAEDPAKNAQEMLARAVVAIDRARTVKVRSADPDGALDAWKGLVAGRWSLVEHFDSDGKRFLVARKNDPHVDEPARITLRERQVLSARARGLPLKLIAYDLGLSVATASRTLQSGMSKLGLVRQADLPTLFGPTGNQTGS